MKIHVRTDRDQLLDHFHVFQRNQKWIGFSGDTHQIVLLDAHEAQVFLDWQACGGKNTEEVNRVLCQLESILLTPTNAQDLLLPINTYYQQLNRCCNLTCNYCKMAGYEDSVDDQIVSQRTIRKTAEIMTTLGAVGVGLHGGEPMLHWDHLKQVILTIREVAPNITIGLTCNGTLVTEEKIAFFRKEQVRVSVELDGSSAEHDMFKLYPSGASSYEDAFRGADLLYSAGLLAAIESTISGTYGFDAATYQWMSERFPNTPIIVSRIKSCDSHMQDHLCRGDQLGQFFHQEINSIEKLEAVFTDATAAVTNILLTPSPSKYMCNCFQDKVSVDLEGNVFLCPKTAHPGQKVGNVFDVDFLNDFQTKRSAAAKFFSKDKVVSTWYMSLMQCCIDSMSTNAQGLWELKDADVLERFFEDAVCIVAENDLFETADKWLRLGF